MLLTLFVTQLINSYALTASLKQDPPYEVVEEIKPTHGSGKPRKQKTAVWPPRGEYMIGSNIKVRYPSIDKGKIYAAIVQDYNATWPQGPYYIQYIKSKHYDTIQYVGERAVRTPAGATTRHIKLATLCDRQRRDALFVQKRSVPLSFL